MPDDHGPISSPEDALRSIEWLRRAIAAIDPHGTASERARHAQAELRARYVAKALDDAGVSLTGYAQGSVRWLAGQPLDRIAVVLDWIAQASAAGNAELLAEAAEYIQPCRPRSNGQCNHGVWLDCARTAFAWQLRGIDPDEARRNVVKPARGGE